MASYIPAYVLQKDVTVFLNTDGSLGISTVIPTPDGGGVPDGDFWAIPVIEGVFTGFTYLPYNPANAVEAVKPLPYAMAVNRVSGRQTSDYFYVIGTQAQYITAAGGGAALPTSIPSALLVHSKPLIPSSQQICFTNTNGNYFITLGVPTLGSNERLYPFGYYNNVALTAASSSGYANTTTLLSFLNTNWATMPNASPAATVSWALSATGIITGTVTGGSYNDVFEGDIININLSA